MSSEEAAKAVTAAGQAMTAVAKTVTAAGQALSALETPDVEFAEGIIDEFIKAAATAIEAADDVIVAAENAFAAADVEFPEATFEAAWDALQAAWDALQAARAKVSEYYLHAWANLKAAEATEKEDEDEEPPSKKPRLG